MEQWLNQHPESPLSIWIVLVAVRFCSLRRSSYRFKHLLFIKTLQTIPSFAWTRHNYLQKQCPFPNNTHFPSRTCVCVCHSHHLVDTRTVAFALARPHRISDTETIIRLPCPKLFTVYESPTPSFATNVERAYPFPLSRFVTNT